MYKAEIAGKEYNLPTTYRDIKLKDYISLYDILQQHKDLPKEINVITQPQFLSLYKKVFLHFIPLEEEVLNKIPIEDVTNVVNMMQEILTVVPKNEYRDSFEFEGITYYYPLPNYENETFGAYIENNHLLSVAEKQKQNNFSVMAEQMAIMCRKKDELYSDEMVKERKILFLELPMDIVWQYSFFLQSLKTEYEVNMQHFLKAKAVTLMS